MDQPTKVALTESQLWSRRSLKRKGEVILNNNTIPYKEGRRERGEEGGKRKEGRRGKRKKR